MQENQYQFLFPIGKIGNANGHPAQASNFMHLILIQFCISASGVIEKVDVQTFQV